MATNPQAELSDEYEVRTYASGDRAGVLSLLETQWGYRPTPVWFEWKYVDDPYRDDVPLTLAEQDGEIVAVQGYVPCRVRRGDRDVLALKPVDAVVHPDHRRQGLYSRITEHAIQHYRDREPAFFFNYPNAASLGAQQQLGWSEVEVVSLYYRLQRPSNVIDDDRVPGPVQRVADGLARAHLGVRDRRSPASGTYAVERYSSPPGDILESIYERDVPQSFHISRDAETTSWLLDAPTYDHTVYVARREGRPEAALATRSTGDGEVYVFDALPMTGDHPAFADLLTTALEDAADADVVSVTDGTLSRELLAQFGFVSYETPGLARVCTPTYMATRPLWRDAADVPFTHETLSDPTNWRRSFMEVTD